MINKKYEIPPEKLFEICISIIHNDRLIEKDDSELRLVFKTKASLLSWGEEISVKIDRMNAKQSKLIISSECHSQLIDWGKNSDNEKEFIEKLEKELK